MRFILVVKIRDGIAVDTVIVIFANLKDFCSEYQTSLPIQIRHFDGLCVSYKFLRNVFYSQYPTH
jgi:hypothetical protein